MKSLDSTLVTPVYLKMSSDEPWPEDKVFYILTRSGLFLCRNHEFFQSCVPAGRWPTELDDQQSFHRIRYPRLPRRMLQQVVAFFDCVWSMHGGEAVVALGWNQKKRKVEVIVPEQRTIVSKSSWGNAFPIGVKYTLPTDLPPELSVYGDFHSHCGMDAYTSQTDADDEFDRSGLHIVVGRLNREPPQFHVEAVIDGTRFRVATNLVLGSYHRRDWKFPKEWLDKVRVDTPASQYSTSSPRTDPVSSYGANDRREDDVARRHEDDSPRRDDDDGDEPVDRDDEHACGQGHSGRNRSDDNEREQNRGEFSSTVDPEHGDLESKPSDKSGSHRLGIGNGTASQQLPSPEPSASERSQPVEPGEETDQPGSGVPDHSLEPDKSFEFDEQSPKRSAGFRQSKDIADDQHE